MSDPLQNLAIDSRNTPPPPRADVRPRMLSFNFKSGIRTALDYAHLYRVDLISPNELQLQFSSHLVKLYGMFLDQIYGQLIGQSEPEITEIDAFHFTPDSRCTRIHKIEITDRQ